MPPKAHFDLASLDQSTLFADKEEIRRCNPQRFDMEQLDGVFLLDPKEKIIIGYKDVRPDEFWVRGHMPNYPLLPGVLICEAGAQMCSFYVQKAGEHSGDFIGFGGLENVRFRAPVRPGNRLIFVAKATKLHPRQTIFNVQAFVGDKMVFEGDIIGVPMKTKLEE